MYGFRKNWYLVKRIYYKHYYLKETVQILKKIKGNLKINFVLHLIYLFYIKFVHTRNDFVTLILLLYSKQSYILLDLSSYFKYKACKLS